MYNRDWESVVSMYVQHGTRCASSYSWIGVFVWAVEPLRQKTCFGNVFYMRALGG